MAARILVVANKSWEVDPLVGVLRSDHGHPSPFLAVAAPASISIPSVAGVVRTVQARLALTTSAGTVEVWCIKDMMDESRRSSSSEEKARVLAYLAAAGDRPSLVVAFGTASLPDQHSFNGSVAIGSTIFVHDSYAASPNPESKWTHPDIGRLLDDADQSLNGVLISSLGRDDRAEIESRFLTPPLNGARPPVLLSSVASTAISDVNVTNPDNYVWADREALDAFAKAAPKRTVAPVETTHGVIRLAIPSSRFIFVSGIANRLGYFNAELSPRPYAQNFVASHNAGIATA